MELIIKMSAAEADEAMAQGLIQALVYPFSSHEEVREAAKKAQQKKQSAEAAPKKEEKKPDPEDEPAERPAEVPEEEPEETPAEEKKEEPKVDITDIRKVLTQAKHDGKRDEMKELFKAFQIHKLPELPEEKYSAFYAKAKELFK